MQYRTKRRNAHRWWIPALCLIVVVGGIFLLRTQLGSLFAALSQSRHTDGMTRGALAVRVEELTARTEYMTALEAEIQTLQSENRLLRDVTLVPSQALRARVVGRADRTLYDRVFIDQGSNTGVIAGAAIHVADAMIGRVIEAYPDRSLIAFTSDPGQVTDAVLVSTSIPVSLHGQGGGSVQFELPREVSVQAGDVLALQSDPSSPVAIVESFSADDRNPVRTVKARIPANIQQLRYVAVSRY